MKSEDFLVPYILSNVFSVFLIFVCFKWPKAGKIVWSLIFIAAGIFNIFTVFANPRLYVQAYGPSAVLPFYQDFIFGVFSRNTAVFVTLIACGQILAGVLLLLRKPLFRLGIIGGVVFLIAISPLGIGSAFPSTLFMAISLIILCKR